MQKLSQTLLYEFLFQICLYQGHDVDDKLPVHPTFIYGSNCTW